eukprot:3317405-Pyramimonas_sp.AAC.1
MDTGEDEAKGGDADVCTEGPCYYTVTCKLHGALFWIMFGPAPLGAPGAHERRREVQELTKAATDGTQRDFTYARDLTREN